MGEQFQTVTVTRLADRHATLHGRDYAESQEYVVPAGSLRRVLERMTPLLSSGDDPGRFSLTVSEPFDPDRPTVIASDRSGS